jgi:3-keto-disaccharide hydrolase
MGDWIDLFNGRDLTGWASKTEHAWKVVGGVSLRADDARQLSLIPGGGVLVNGDSGRTPDLHTVIEYGSCELQLEFCVAQKSNSGVYLMGNYEIQILDSFGTPESELSYASCGGIYARWIAETKSSYDGHPPRANASRPPGEWQSLEVTFHAPQFDTAGEKIAGARFVRVLQNGVLIHENVECTGPTRGAWSSTDLPLGPLRLQGDHGPVAYRYLRLRPLE